TELSPRPVTVTKGIDTEKVPVRGSIPPASPPPRANAPDTGWAPPAPGGPPANAAGTAANPDPTRATPRAAHRATRDNDIDLRRLNPAVRPAAPLISSSGVKRSATGDAHRPGIDHDPRAGALHRAIALGVARSPHSSRRRRWVGRSTVCRWSGWPR